MDVDVNSNTSELGIQVVYIEVVRNQTLAPQLGSFVSNKYTRQIIRQRTFHYIRSNIQESNYILQVTLIDYSKGTESL